MYISDGDIDLILGRLVRTWREMASDESGAHSSSFRVCADQLQGAMTAIRGRVLADPVRLIVEVTPGPGENSIDIARYLGEAWREYTGAPAHDLRIAGKIEDHIG